MGMQFLPVDNFTRDFQIIAESLGHEHFLIVSRLRVHGPTAGRVSSWSDPEIVQWEDRVVPQSEWDKGYAKPYDALWSGQPVPVSLRSIPTVLGRATLADIR